MHQLHLLLERVFNVPHLCTDGKLDTIIAVLAERANLTMEVPEALFFTGKEKEPAADTGPMRINASGVAEIPVRGTLTRRVSGLHPSSGMVGYNQIADMADMAMSDPSVRQLAFNFDTHGGEGTGAMELHDYMKSMRGRKPMTSVVGANCLSAGYLLACATDRIVVPELSNIGSIGVVMAHSDISQALAKEGVKVTYVYAGKHKVDGASTEPLSDTARAMAQKRVNMLYDAFVQRVAESRGISADAVRATEALIFSGRDAIGNSLADEVANERDALAALKQQPATLRIKVPTVSFQKR